MGFTGLALSAILFKDGIARADSGSAWRPPNGQAHFPPRAKSGDLDFSLRGHQPCR